LSWKTSPIKLRLKVPILKLIFMFARFFTAVRGDFIMLKTRDRASFSDVDIAGPALVVLG
jgi:hypothetical protein